MSDFFIDRPIFAWVLAIMMMVVGIVSITQLPIEQYPEVAPPGVTISTINPGASAETGEKTVVQVIEQAMTGIDNVLYMSSTADSSGRSEVRINFLPGTDPDIAQVQVQNKLQAAMPQLPQAVRDQGVKVNKTATGVMMVVALSAQMVVLITTMWAIIWRRIFLSLSVVFMVSVRHRCLGRNTLCASGWTRIN
ncbi:MAG: hypothetical protein DRR42_22170 [Gammaproteobacteria bacterium]|nr:MAG: hypothetical protein DRR42_22170 [Gammaproteobacteria bacterium]